jgi:hypothetical protein
MPDVAPNDPRINPWGEPTGRKQVNNKYKTRITFDIGFGDEEIEALVQKFCQRDTSQYTSQKEHLPLQQKVIVTEGMAMGTLAGKVHELSYREIANAYADAITNKKVRAGVFNQLESAVLQYRVNDEYLTDGYDSQDASHVIQVALWGEVRFVD